MMIPSSGAKYMLKRHMKSFVGGGVILCLVFLTPLLSQDEPKEVKKPDLIEMQLNDKFERHRQANGGSTSKGRDQCCRQRIQGRDNKKCRPQERGTAYQNR